MQAQRTEIAPAGALIISYPLASRISAGAAARASLTPLSASALATATSATILCGYVSPSATPAAASTAGGAIHGWWMCGLRSFDSSGTQRATYSPGVGRAQQIGVDWIGWTVGDRQMSQTDAAAGGGANESSLSNRISAGLLPADAPVGSW